MERWFRKHGFIDEFTIVLTTTKADFVDRLKKAVDPQDLSLLSGMTEAWQAGQNDYVGEVSHEGFRIRKRKTFFQANGFPNAVATGTFKETRETLTIETIIRSQTKWLLPFYAIATLLYLSIFSALGYAAISGAASSELYFLVPFLLVHAGLMFYLPYWLLKRSVAKTRRDLEREFFWIAGRNEK